MAYKFGLFILGVVLACWGPDEVVAKVIGSLYSPRIFHGKSIDQTSDETSVPNSIKTPKVSLQDLVEVEVIAQEIVSRMERLEQNLVSSTKVIPGTPSWVASLEGEAPSAAQRLSKEAYISAKATYYLRDKFCSRYGSRSDECLNQIKKTIKKNGNLQVSCRSGEYRLHSGACNRPFAPTLGAVLTPYSRLLEPSYSDGIWQPRQPMTLGQRGNPIHISRSVLAEGIHFSDETPNVTMSMLAWGEVVALDLAHTSPYNSLFTGEKISCCKNGRKLSPRYRHPLCLNLADNEGSCVDYVRSMLVIPEREKFPLAQQMNTASHFLDGSAIYGTSPEAARRLRKGKGGELKLFDSNGKRELASCSGKPCILSGDTRWSLGVVPSVMHTVLVNEHNRLARGLKKINENWDDERLYQEARRILIGEIQHITYSEWLPLLLGPKIYTEYKDLILNSDDYSEVYNSAADPTVSNAFANAAMRFIPSLMDEDLSLYNEDWKKIGSVSLDTVVTDLEALENPEFVPEVVRGLLSDNCQEADLRYPDAVVKHMYGHVGAGAVDGLALDIHRGREHGLPPYNEYRTKYSSPRSSEENEVLTKLLKIYDNEDDIDLVVGGLSETPLEGGLLGPTFANIISEQMVRTRTGDSYFYDSKHQPLPFTKEQLQQIRKSSLAQLYCLNVNNLDSVQPSAFRSADSEENQRIDCSKFKNSFDFTHWKV